MKKILTSVLASDEIDPIAKLNLEITVAHEILKANPNDRTGARSLIVEGITLLIAMFTHLCRFLGFRTQKNRRKLGV